MKAIDGEKYIRKLYKRYTGHVTKQFQSVGLEVANILGDLKHKSLYIKYAKENPKLDLIALAKSVIDRRNVKHPPSYFMKIMQNLKSNRAVPAGRQE